MLDGYYNFNSRTAEGGWERREFLNAWWRLQALDRRWVPPYRPALATAIHPARGPHIARQQPAYLWLEALPGKPNYSGTLSHRQLSSVLMDQPVATSLLLADPRRRDGSACLALFGCANDVESLERLVSLALEQAWARGRTRLVGPCALSPHLGEGALLNHFDQQPPLQTPYQPPYLPEVLDAVMDRGPHSHLYTVTPHHHEVTGPASLRRLVATDRDAILPRLLAGLDGRPGAPPPDELETQFLLAWWQIAPLDGIVAEVDGQPAGVVLLQPDLGPALRLARGGRNLLWRLWLAWRRGRGARSGRIPALVVLPAWRRRGIGGQLWRAGVSLAHAHGWRELTIGPVTDESSGADFLRSQDAVPRQRYCLYSVES